MKKTILTIVLLLSIVSQPCFAASQVFAESHIAGAFEGWTGETIIKLENGMIWEQAEYYYRYFYKYRPEVLIIIKAGSYYALVEGIDKLVRVQRLK